MIACKVCGMETGNASANVHRALSSPVRARLLDLLRAAPDPRGVEALAERLDLHVNTVRAHLALLEDAGLVASEPEPRGRPGRPRLVYRVTDRAAQVDQGGGYRFLAQALASYVAATASDPPAAGREAGAAWGRHLVARPAPFETVTVDAAMAEVVDLLDAFGFDPQLDTGEPTRPRVHLRRCPFLDVAREHQDVVCSLHLGLLQGALAELGSDLEATDLLPLVEPDLCIAHLQVSP